MTKYFRATGYYPKEDISFIIDSNGKFDARWQLGSMLAQKDCEVITISDYDKIQEVKLTKASPNSNSCIIRAIAKGRVSKDVNKITVGKCTYKIQ